MDLSTYAVPPLLDGLEWMAQIPSTDWDSVRESICTTNLQQLCDASARAINEQPVWVFSLSWILLLVFFELIRYSWYRIQLISLNFRRHTPPSLSDALDGDLDERADFVERVCCDRSDHAYFLEGFFLGRRAVRLNGDFCASDKNAITRDMTEEALLACLAMEVRWWYGEQFHRRADRIVDSLEDKLGHPLPCLPLRRRTVSGGSIAEPADYDTDPDSIRKPFMYIGQQRLCAYFKPLPVQLGIWTLKILKSFLLKKWGFQCHKLGPVQIWLRKPTSPTSREHQHPLLFCPGLFLGNAAYLGWISSGLLPLGDRRPLLLLELPHLSHGLDPRKVAYSLFYSWPRSDEITSAIVRFLEMWDRPTDVIGNSFGTSVMTMLRKHHSHMFRKFIYIDPVCFIPCFPTPILTVHAPYMDSYSGLLAEARKHVGSVWDVPAKLIKYLLLRPTIFGDLEVQYVVKRGLYLHETIEHGSIGAESLVIIGNQDELLHDPPAVARWVAQHWPRVSLELVNCNHGALMGKPGMFAKLVWHFLEDSA
eukprot:TRINITY_DN22635_c0_g1_i1.p1 TRINITY_DN22635_c0_g1~~TRINITY_DN22635_c0_g1_i1.p1  ORF type:complete len:535 (+),score=54.15 TRINITY_DN22635_c0_g1_i1:122-1726(+)